jgi:hypothetical protein
VADPGGAGDRARRGWRRGRRLVVRDGREDDYEGRIDFVQEQETAGTPLADEVRALAGEIESTQA